MDCLGARGVRCFDDGGTVEVAGCEAHRLIGVSDKRRVGVGVDKHGHNLDAHVVRGADDAASNFAAVGNEDR
ncbi:unannotated protein [freshwater metagenome]|uniref:Unannotated protein n=1 Tax=freshwater metagenome TaxID=449393 RepID=A0A6J6P3A4_9ZZZZ